MRKNIGKKQQKSAPVEQSAETVQLKPKRQKRWLEDSMYLQIEEIQAFFAAIKTMRDKAIFRLVYHRGLRAHEVGLLQLSDFRARDGVLFVRRGKGSISREHSLTDEELRCLRAWIKERGTMPGVLFPSRQGTRGITRGRMHQLMVHYCELAGIPKSKAHCHALKHSCGTHLADRGNAPDEIQDWLGHRDSSSTDIYMHFSGKRRKTVVDKNKDWR